MHRRRYLRETLVSVGATAGLGGCVTATTDPASGIIVRLHDIDVVRAGDGWQSTVAVGYTRTAGIGETPAVRKPRLVLFDDDRTAVASVRLPITGHDEESDRITPPATAETQSNDTTATRSTAETSTPKAPTEAYATFGVPAETTVETTTATFPAWIGFEFDAVRSWVRVELGRYAGTTPPSESAPMDSWELSTHRYTDGPFPATDS